MIILKKESPDTATTYQAYYNPHPADIAERMSFAQAVDCAPSTIYAAYGTDLNIINIHNVVKARFASLHGTVMLLITKREKLTSKLKECRFDVEHRSMVDKINKITSQINSIINGGAWDSYISMAGPMLKVYDEKFHNTEIKQICQIPKNISHPSDLDVYKNSDRIIIIQKYLEVAGRFININSQMKPVDVSTCEACGAKRDPVKEDVIFSEYGLKVCECGRETVGISPINTYKDNGRIDLGSRNSYDDLVNFVKRIDAFEGIQKTKPPPALYEQLEAFFKKSGKVKPMEEIMKLPLNGEGKKEGTSVELLSEALLETHNSAFYKDTELIANVLWGWRLGDLTSNGLRDILVADYIATQSVYHQIKERESSLNVNLRLWFHLTARDYPCSITDFKMLSSQDSIHYHNKCFTIMAKRTGLKFVTIKPTGKKNSLKTRTKMSEGSESATV